MTREADRQSAVPDDLPPVEDELIAYAAELVRTAESVLVLTGAGVSDESGLPTFSGELATWEDYPKRRFATPEGFHEDPRGVWLWYNWRIGLLMEAEPNAGHFALAALERWCKQNSRDFLLVTQNVDALHRKAGNGNLLELHGNAYLARPAGKPQSSDDLYQIPEPPLPEIPLRNDAGELLRPHVVWFNETSDPDLKEEALDRAKATDVFISVGTSCRVNPTRLMAERCKQAGGSVIEVNPAESEISDIADLKLSGKAGDVLPRVIAELPGTEGIPQQAL